MDQRDGLEEWSEGWTDKRMEGCCNVVLIVFRKFLHFRQKSIFAKSKIFIFSSKIHFCQKRNFSIFVGHFAKKRK
jgi:hypothetical protein